MRFNNLESHIPPEEVRGAAKTIILQHHHHEDGTKINLEPIEMKETEIKETKKFESGDGHYNPNAGKYEFVCNCGQRITANFNKEGTISIGYQTELKPLQYNKITAY